MIAMHELACGRSLATYRRARFSVEIRAPRSWSPSRTSSSFATRMGLPVWNVLSILLVSGGGASFDTQNDLCGVRRGLSREVLLIVIL